MSGFTPASMTQKLISQKPLTTLAAQQAELIAKWLDNSILPSVARSSPGLKADQPWEITEVIISHLKKVRVSDALIAAALDKSAYAFSFNARGASPQFAGVSLQMGLLKIARKDERTKEKQPSMYPQEMVSIQEFNLRARDIEVRYIANMHDPGLQADLLKMLIGLISLALESVKLWSEVRTEKEKSHEIHRQVLANAPAASANIRTVSSMELAVLRYAAAPNAPGTVYRAPNLVRPVRGR